MTVTLVAAEPSPTEIGLSDSVTAVGAASLSVIVRVAVPDPRPVAVPVNSTVSSPSAKLSSAGSKLSVAVPLVALAAIVTLKPLTAG